MASKNYLFQKALTEVMSPTLSGSGYKYDLMARIDEWVAGQTARVIFERSDTGTVWEELATFELDDGTEQFARQVYINANGVRCRVLTREGGALLTAYITQVD